jgi:hypothetical protein
MQLTRFDRWLRETLVYETHIHTLRPVENPPKGIKVIELPDSPMQRYRHLYISRKSADADALIKLLRDNTQMFTTEVIERKTWFTPLVAPEGKSVTWRLLSTIVTVSIVLAVGLWVRNLLSDPKIREALHHALELAK